MAGWLLCRQKMWNWQLWFIEKAYHLNNKENITKMPTVFCFPRLSGMKLCMV